MVCLTNLIEELPSKHRMGEITFGTDGPHQLILLDIDSALLISPHQQAGVIGKLVVAFKRLRCSCTLRATQVKARLCRLGSA